MCAAVILRDIDISARTSAGTEPTRHTFYVKSHPRASEQICFRDYMRDHPQVAEAYSTLKEKLAEENTKGMVEYLEGKKEFMETVMETAIAAGYGDRRLERRGSG